MVIERPHKDEIQRLLLEARDALDTNRLTTPVEDNAYYRFVRILSFEPDNPQALLGLTEIVEQYIAWAIDHAQQRNFTAARNYLNKAKSVDQFHPNIQAVENLIEKGRSSSPETIVLSQMQVAARGESLAEELQLLGQRVIDLSATVIIIARSDAQGRWIYQQLNRRSSSRIRAHIEFGERPQIQLVY
jgi:hypothetical protein